MNCDGGKNPHNTDIWAILAVKFDTVYKVLNYLPNTLIPTFYFPQYMRYHSPSWRVFIFPLCLSELWAPFRLRAAKKRSITSSRKTTRALSCCWESWLSMNPALFFPFPPNELFSALDDFLHAITIFLLAVLISRAFLECKLRALNVSMKLLRWIHEAKAPSCP